MDPVIRSAILRALAVYKNAYVPIQQIAQEASLSEDVVKDHMDVLAQEGLVQYPSGMGAGKEKVRITSRGRVEVAALSPCPPVIPGTYHGSVTVNGEPPADGLWVQALIDDVEWASAVSLSGRYVMNIPERLSASPPCFTGGKIVFRCGEFTAAESPEWVSGIQNLALTFEVAEANVQKGGTKVGASVPRDEVEPHDDILVVLDSRGDEVVSAAEIGAALNIDVPLVEGYLDELESEAVVEVARSFGSYSAFITPRGRVRAERLRRRRVSGSEAARAVAPAAATEASMDDASQHYFVAHEFSAEKKDDLRGAIEDALGDSGLTPYYADNELRQGHIFTDKILPRIRHTRFGIYDISNSQKPNVFLELGAAIVIGKPYFIICKSDTDIPADLEGLDRIEYQSYTDLTKQLRAKIRIPGG